MLPIMMIWVESPPGPGLAGLLAASPLLLLVIMVALLPTLTHSLTEVGSLDHYSSISYL